MAIPYQDRRAKRNTDRSDIPMCMARLQNQAKKVTCQKVNLVWPGRGSPPVQMVSFATDQKSPTDVTPSSRAATMPKPRKTRTIHGAATLANRATLWYP